MSEHTEAVKRVSAFLRKRADQAKRAERHEVAESYDAHAATLEAAADELARLASLTMALPQDLGNLHELPQELLDELSVTKTDELEDQLVTVINAYGGTASLDQILVGLYHKFGVMQKRRFTQNKLYRMTKAGLVWSVEGRKGIYTTHEPDQAKPDDPDEINRLAKEALEDDASEIPF